MVHRDRVVGEPRLDLLGRAVRAGVGAAVPAVAVRLRLDQRRPAARPGAFDGRPGGEVHGVGVVAVDDRRLQAVGRRPVGGGVADGGDLADRRVLHVQVVLAHEDRRQLVHGGEVERLVEGADVRRPVTEEGHGDLVGAAQPGRPRRPVGDAQVGADDGVAAHHPVLDAGQVHRTALAAEQAGAPPEHLGDDRSRRHAAGDRVAVAAVGGERVVVGAQGHAERRGGRLHAEGEVAGALDEVLQEQVVEPLLELADLLLAAVQLQARVDVDVGVVEGRVERLRQDRARRLDALDGGAHSCPVPAAVLRCDCDSRSVGSGESIVQ